MSDTDFTINVDERRPLRQFAWTAMAVAWADRLGPKMAAELRKEAPVGHGPTGGRLRDSIRYRRHTSIGAISLEFYTNVPYAEYVLHGTKPHLIAPKAALALHFNDARGGEVFARFVRHPGTKPNNFPGRVAQRMLPEIAAVMAVEIKERL